MIIAEGVCTEDSDSIIVSFETLSTEPTTSNSSPASLTAFSVPETGDFTEAIVA